jgi:hypothetical protein
MQSIPRFLSLLLSLFDKERKKVSPFQRLAG